MQINEFLDNVSNQIKYKPIRNEISKELENHIKDSKENYMQEGMNEEKAEEEAIKQMGSAEEIGKKLNKIHKPKMNWQLLILALILFGFSFLVNYIGPTGRWKLNFITIIISIIPFVLIYFFDYRKLQKHSNLIYSIATIIVLYSIINDIHLELSSIAIPLYIISFIGFIENINIESKVKIEYFEKRNININLLKIIILSIMSLILLVLTPTLTSAFILALIYLTVITIKLIQDNKKKQIIILWGIPLLFVVLISFIILNSSFGDFRVNRLISSFMPEKDPNDTGWIGMEQKTIIESANLYGKADNVGEGIQIFNEGTNYAFIAVLANYGWIISITMVVMIIVFNAKLIFDSRKVKDGYGKFLIMGISCLFIFRSMFCILMNLNLGIQANFDIPFISYGKLNLVMDIISLSLVFSVYRKKDIVFNLSKFRLT